MFAGFIYDALLLDGNERRAIPIVIVNNIHVSPNEAAVKWYRSNAPESAKDLTDTELWQLIGNDYLNMLREEAGIKDT